ncbi:MAG: hypothetical protein AAGE52_42200 [Myxococcota bacterium]
MWVCGGLIWVRGEHPAETMLDVVGLSDALPVGYRTREEVTSRSFVGQTMLRAVFREAGFTFLLEPDRLRNGSFVTLEPLSDAYGEAWGFSLNSELDLATAGHAHGGKVTGWVYAAGPDVRDVNGDTPDMDLSAPTPHASALSLLERSVGRTLESIVFEGAKEQAGSTDDPWIAAVLDHEAVAEVFSLEAT